MSHPRVGQDKRKPKADTDGTHNVGKPCIVCGKFTIGIKWIQINCMRGDDVEVRVCLDHWRHNSDNIIKSFNSTNEAAKTPTNK